MDESHSQSDFEEDGDVKVKVKTWVYGFVNEMRKKSPASIQKWVDSIKPESTHLNNLSNSSNTNNQSTSSNLADTATSSTDQQTIIDQQSQQAEIQVKQDEAIKPADKGEAQPEPEATTSSNLDDKVKETKEVSGSTAESLKSLSKQRFNELFGKLNKKKNLLKTKSRTELKSLIARTSMKFKLPVSRQNSVEEKCLNDEEEKVEESAEVSQPKLTIDTNASPVPVPRVRRQRLKDIGRSFSLPDDDVPLPVDDPSETLTPNSPQPPLEEDLVFDEDKTASSSIISSNISVIDCSVSNLNATTKSVPISPVHNNQSFHREHALSESHSPRHYRNPFMRDSSFQSDSSHCSSVESLLESRKPDAEAILVNLGFGPAQSDDVLSKIPKRFLRPSQVRGVDTEAFLRQQQLAVKIHETSCLGFNGLIGNPHIHPSMIVAKIMQRFSLNEKNRLETDNCANYHNYQNYQLSPSPSPNGKNSFRNVVANQIIGLRQQQAAQYRRNN